MQSRQATAHLLAVLCGLTWLSFPLALEDITPNNRWEFVIRFSMEGPKPQRPTQHLPLTKALSFAQLTAGRPWNSSCPKSWIFLAKRSDRLRGAQHPWEVRSYSWWCHPVGTSVAARSAGCHRRGRTFQTEQEGLAHMAAVEEAGKENSACLEGGKCCNGHCRAWKQVEVGALEHCWTEQSEEGRDLHRPGPLAVVGSNLRKQKIFTVLSQSSRLSHVSVIYAAVWGDRMDYTSSGCSCVHGGGDGGESHFNCEKFSLQVKN